MTDTGNTKTATFSVYQTDVNDGTSECLYWGLTEKEAQAEADRINRDLAERGIPSWVSTAYVAWGKLLHDDTSHHHPPAMTDQHPITPPPELVQQWIKECDQPDDPRWEEYEQDIATRAAQWGYEQRGEVNEAELQQARDEELEACCDWMSECTVGCPNELRAVRRPKPPSLKEQALAALSEADQGLNESEWRQRSDTIRRALEALPDD